MIGRRALVAAGFSLGAAVSLNACSRTPTEPTMTSSAPGADPTPGAGGRVVLAYFSRAGENYFNGGRINLEVGNTEVVANLIAAAADVDVYRIEAADPYPASYDRTVARNVQEEQANARPAIANPLPDLSAYTTLVLGCPVWNVQTPMIMRTFVEGVDLAGKTVHPFVTYAVSGMGQVRSNYTSLLPNTTVTEGLAVRGEEAKDSGPDVRAWLRQLGLAGS
jgi:flavodoxin